MVSKVEKILNLLCDPVNRFSISKKDYDYYFFYIFRWGMKIKKRMGKVEQWAEKQGLELAADCHLARVVQAAHLLQARKNTAEDIASVSSICFKLNSVQLRTLLDLYEPSPDERPISREMIGKSNIPVPERQDNLPCNGHICKYF